MNKSEFLNQIFEKRNSETLKSLRELGIELNNPDGTFKTLHEIIDDISKVLDITNDKDNR